MAKRSTKKKAEAAPAAKGAPPIPMRPTKPCPVCEKPSDRTHFPFCSKRCADVDLNRWLSGVYVVPGTPDEEALELAIAESESEDERA